MVYPPADGKTPCAVTNLHTIRLHEKIMVFHRVSTLNYGNCNRVKYAYRLKIMRMNGQKPFLANILLDTISFPPENMCSKSVPQTRKDIGLIK